jgi:hypothetical protein
MKLNITVDLNDFYEGYEADLDREIKEQIKGEVVKLIKRDPRYKAYVNKRADEFISAINI